MNIGDAIYGILNGTAAVTAITSTRITPHRIKQGDTLPAITYSYIDNSPTHIKDGVSTLDVITMDVDMYSDGGTDQGSGSPYRDLVNLANEVRTALDRYSGTNSSVVIDSIKFDGQQEMYENEMDVYHISQQYSIRERI